MNISKILIYSTLLISIFCSTCTDKAPVEKDEDCNGLAVEDDDKVCVRDSNENTCVETDVCTNVKYTATPEICYKLQISGEGDETYACSKNSAEGSTDCIETNKCKEILYVKEEGDCSKFSISEENKDTHACIKNKESDAKNCIETNVCLEVTVGATDEICSKLNATSPKICVKEESGVCKETDIC